MFLCFTFYVLRITPHNKGELQGSLRSLSSPLSSAVADQVTESMCKV